MSLFSKIISFCRVYRKGNTFSLSLTGTYGECSPIGKKPYEDSKTKIKPKKAYMRNTICNTPLTKLRLSHLCHIEVEQNMAVFGNANCVRIQKIPQNWKRSSTI